MNQDRSNIQIISRDRKKSDMGYCKSGIEVNVVPPKL